MPLERDEAKRAGNFAKHGLDFELAEHFEWQSALVRADVRFDDNEARLVAIGPISSDPGRLVSLTFAIRRRAVRVISRRPASRREIRLYVAESTTE